MDINELRLFVHLCQTLHFGKTSRELNVSPSSLSRTIQRIEAELGHILFQRDNRKMSITSSGKIFLDYAVNVLNQWEILKQNLVEDARELKGELSIFSSVTASYSILPDILSNFRACYPNVHLKLKTGDAHNAIKYVMNDDVDISIAAKPNKLNPVLLFKSLIETPLVFVCINNTWDRNYIIDKNSIDWAKVPMIISDKGLARERIDKWFQKKCIVPNIFAEVSGNEAIISMVRLGCGIGVVPKLVFDNNPLKEALVIMDVYPQLKPYSVGICIHRSKVKSPLIKAFWNIAEKLC